MIVDARHWGGMNLWSSTRLERNHSQNKPRQLNSQQPRQSSKMRWTYPTMTKRSTYQWSRVVTSLILGQHHICSQIFLVSTTSSVSLHHKLVLHQRTDPYGHQWKGRWISLESPFETFYTPQNWPEIWFRLAAFVMMATPPSFVLRKDTSSIGQNEYCSGWLETRNLIDYGIQRWVPKLITHTQSLLPNLMLLYSSIGY